MRGWTIGGIGLASACLVAGCASPLGETRSDDWQAAVSAAIERQVAGSGEAGEPQRLEQGESAVEATLADRREELDGMTPTMGDLRMPGDLGADLVGGDQSTVDVSLDGLIRMAVEQNLGVRQAVLQPAINREDVIRAEAAFDALLFGSLDWTRTERPTAVPAIMGIPLGTGSQASDALRFETGVRKTFHSGGTATISTDLTRSDNRNEGLSTIPDPAYDAAVRLGFRQPLLRNFGEAVNTATIRLAQNATDRAEHQLERALLDVVRQVEDAYWDLAFAWLNLEITEWLVVVGEEVRDILDRRREFDTLPAEYADAVATVESRNGNVIRAQRAVRAASDRLKQLVNDPAISVGTETVLKPSDALDAAAFEFDLGESILTAMAERPELAEALENIDDTAIRELVAENAVQPLLDAKAEIAWFGLDDGAGDAYGNAFDFDHVGYVLGLVFEYPLGNRAAESGARQARLQRSTSVLAYQQVVQGIVVEVKAALRDVRTNWDLIEQSRSFRVAQAENLRALLVQEETMAGLTPEFLNLKFQRQDGLAAARQQELRALVDFRQAVAALFRAQGTGLRMHQIVIESVGDPSDFDVVRPSSE